MNSNENSSYTDIEFEMQYVQLLRKVGRENLRHDGFDTIRGEVLETMADLREESAKRLKKELE